MEIILIELLLWAGLIFFFWALRDGLSQVDSEPEMPGAGGGILSTNTSVISFDRPETVSEPIGSYRDKPIYRYAIIEGRRYEFAHVLPWDSLSVLEADERCIAPGLVYFRYGAPQ